MYSMWRMHIFIWFLVSYIPHTYITDSPDWGTDSSFIIHLELKKKVQWSRFGVAENSSCPFSHLAKKFQNPWTKTSHLYFSFHLRTHHTAFLRSLLQWSSSEFQSQSTDHSTCPLCSHFHLFLTHLSFSPPFKCLRQANLLGFYISSWMGFLTLSLLFMFIFTLFDIRLLFSRLFLNEVPQGSIPGPQSFLL